MKNKQKLTGCGKKYTKLGRGEREREREYNEEGVCLQERGIINSSLSPVWRLRPRLWISDIWLSYH